MFLLRQLFHNNCSLLIFDSWCLYEQHLLYICIYGTFFFSYKFGILNSKHLVVYQIDFLLGSWIHSELPTGGALNITSLSAYLNSLTDAPNFLIELIQSSPTSLILILDLPPRKDLVFNPDYLHTFYEGTQLDTRRQILEKIPEVRPYISSSLYIRSLVSPTAIMVRIETEASQPGRVEELIKDNVDPIAKEVLDIWLDQCACGKREVGETERAFLEKRDGLIKTKTFEVDLGLSFPRLFGPEVAYRVLGAIRDFFTV